MTMRIISLLAFAVWLVVAILASQRESAAERNERLLRLAASISTEQLR